MGAALVLAITIPLGIAALVGGDEDEEPRTADTSPGVPPDDPGRVLWEGGFDVGGVPEGTDGPSCGTGTADGPSRSTDQYSDVDELGNTECTNEVELSDELTRTDDSRRALKVVMAANQQREQLRSELTWTPDDEGSVEHWYGFSLYYDDDWDDGGGLLEEVSADMWHSAASWRTSGANGSMNFSGDMNLNNGNGEPYEEFDEPHMVLRRNTVLNDEGFYEDGKGLDKLDLGPIVTGEWMDFVCHIRWSTTETNALRECWRDGEYMGKRTSLNAVDTNPHTFRAGLYQTTEIDHQRTMYVDNVRIGTSYIAVDPARKR